MGDEDCELSRILQNALMLNEEWRRRWKEIYASKGRNCNNMKICDTRSPFTTRSLIWEKSLKLRLKPKIFLYGFGGESEVNISKCSQQSKKTEMRKKKKIEQGRRKRPAAPCNGFFIYRLSESLLLWNIWKTIMKIIHANVWACYLWLWSFAIWLKWTSYRSA